MLACLQRPNQPARLQPPQLTCAAQILDTPLRHKSEPSSARSLRYPSAAELDAYAQRTADSPLSIKIFPANIRVPQHKQISRTVNGLDTRFSPCSLPYAGGYQGLLAIVKTKGVLKSSDGKRAKLSPIQMAVAPYVPPRRPYGSGSHAVVQQMSRPSNVHSSPSFTAASCAESGFTVAQNGLAYSGAVLPTQSADVAGLGSDYWPHRSLLRVYGSGSGATVSRSAELCYRSHPVTSSPFSVGQFFAPAPDSDCYNPPELPAGSSMGTGHPHLHTRPPPYPPGKSRCQASLLSSSLRSLESLISEIRPPCIKERMLGRGYAAGPLPLEHQPAHLQLPVFR